MAELEALINSRTLTVETVSDSNSLILISPSNLLTMKTSVIMPLQWTFKGVDLYCKKKWRRIQHITNVFRSRWKKEKKDFLISLKTWMRWNEIWKLDIMIIVLLKDEYSQNQWPIARISQIETDKRV